MEKNRPFEFIHQQKNRFQLIIPDEYLHKIEEGPVKPSAQPKLNFRKDYTERKLLIPLSITEQLELAQRRRNLRRRGHAAPRPKPTLDPEHPMAKKFARLALKWAVLMFPKQLKFLRDCQNFMYTHRALFPEDGNMGSKYEQIRKNIFQNPALLTFRTTGGNQNKNDTVD